MAGGRSIRYVSVTRVEVEVAIVEIMEWIVERYDRTHKRGNWAARGVLPALEGVTAEMAHWRPAPDQHTIAEMVAHMAYHRELVAKRLRGGPREYRPEDEFPPVPPTEAGWAQAREGLERAHENVTGALAELAPGQLFDALEGSWLSVKLATRKIDMAVDIATHDLYHAGQIFLIKRVFAARREM